MSRLLRSRSAILAALEAGGVNTATTAKWSAPVVLVEPGEPWAGVELSLGRKRTGRWRLTVISGRADTEGALELLADLVDRVDVQLLTVPSLELPTWSRPLDVQLGGVAYAATTATIQLLTPTMQEVLP